MESPGDSAQPDPALALPVAGRSAGIVENSRRRSLRVVELPRCQRPDKGYKPKRTKPKRRRNHVNQDRHSAFPVLAPASLRAFNVTTAEEADMAMAATSGVAQPANAIGTAATL